MRAERSSRPECRLVRDVVDDSGADGWVSRIPHGDATAFTTMVDQFAGPLRRFAFRFTRSRDVAAEVVQDVFFKVWTNRAAGAVFEGRLELRAYLYRATRNTALDCVARELTRSKHRKASQADSADRVIPFHAAPADMHAELADLLATIDHVLAAMPDRRRAVCVLRWRHGLSVAEIAERLGISAKTVEVQVGRGLRQLRERIARAH
jgi:RNA polymerase sigma-70 factor (ECF subfamily)